MELKLILQIVGFTLGLLYLWLEYRANIYLWLVGLVMPVVHGTLYFQTGLYADFGMNVYYFLASVYGWLAAFGHGLGHEFGADIRGRINLVVAGLNSHGQSKHQATENQHFFHEYSLEESVVLP